MNAKAQNRGRRMTATEARLSTTEQLINAAVARFAAPRGEKTIFAGGRSMKVHTPGEMILHLPNGSVVKVTTDDSGVATQIEENDNLHAVVRPKTVRLYPRI